jgi:hypothetical protein
MNWIGIDPGLDGAIAVMCCSSISLIDTPTVRHANVSVTQAYYIKTAADDVRAAMQKLEDSLAVQDTFGTSEEKPIVM